MRYDVDEKQFGEIMEKMNSALSMARSNPQSNGAPIKAKLFALQLKRRGCSSIDQAESLPKAEALDLANDIISIFNTAGWASEVPATLAPFFDPPYAPDFGFSVLLNVDADSKVFLQTVNHLAARSNAGQWFPAG